MSDLAIHRRLRMLANACSAVILVRQLPNAGLKLPRIITENQVTGHLGRDKSPNASGLPGVGSGAPTKPLSSHLG